MQNNAFPKQKEIIDIYKQKTLNFNNFPAYAEMRNSQDFIDTIYYTMKSMTNSGNYYFDFLCALDEKIASGKIPTEKIGGAKNAELLEDITWDEGNIDNFEKIIRLSEYLDSHNIISKNELVLSMMESMHNYKIKEFVSDRKNDPMLQYYTSQQKSNFYNNNWNDYFWNYTIAESIFEAYGMQLDKEQVKKLFLEKTKKRMVLEQDGEER